MARNPINPDIGEIKCPFCGLVAPVRKDRNGKLYYVSKAGMIKPNLPEGQEWMLEHATIWGANKPQQEPLTEHVPVTASGNEPAAKVPVNGEKPTPPVNVSQSAQTKTAKPDFLKFLIG